MSERRCIFIMADGARADLFEYLLEKGLLPNIGDYIVSEGGYRRAVTVFPSTTGPAYLPFIIGKYPGRCNIPGIRWFDRKKYNKKISISRFRSYIGPGTYLINRDMSSNGVPTLFELFPDSVSIMNEITRGVSFFGDKTRFSKLYYKIKGHFTDRSDIVDHKSGDLILESLKRRPTLIFSVFLGVDTYSHQYHPFHRKVVEAYRRIDRYIGEICKRLKREGLFEDTLIIIGSDHGLTSTHTHFDSLGFMSSLGYKTLSHPYIFRYLIRADAANMVSGNSMAHLYFRGNSKDWVEYTYIEELEHVVERLLEQEAVDLVMGRSGEGKIAVRSREGSAILWKENESFFYETKSGDPLALGSHTSVLDISKTLSFTYNTQYPDSFTQIYQLFESPRTGDIVISAAKGYDLRARYENPEHCASHGSLDKEHMLVPLAMNKRITSSEVRTVDIYPSIVRFLGKNVFGDVDGCSIL